MCYGIHLIPFNRAGAVISLPRDQLLQSSLFSPEPTAPWVGFNMLLLTPSYRLVFDVHDKADGDIPLATPVLFYNLVLHLTLLRGICL